MIIPTRGPAAFLPRVIQATLADPATAELIVVVDGLDQESLEWLTPWASSESRLDMVAMARAGGDCARQRGVVLAREDVLLFLDDDVVPEPGLVSGHVAQHGHRTRRIVLGYMPLVPEPIRRRDDLPAVLYQEGYEHSCATYEADPAQILLGFWAGNFSIRRADAVRVGLSDYSFRQGYHGDRDFGLRCRSAGLEPLFDRSLRARHHRRHSYADFRAESVRQGAGRLEIHRRHPEAVGELLLQDYELGLTPLARRLLRLTRRARLRALARVGLPPAAAWACIARRPRLALEIAKLDRSIEQQHGTLAAVRERRSGSGIKGRGDRLPTRAAPPQELAGPEDLPPGGGPA